MKILSDFQPEQEWVVEPGDILYLPPNWAHDGVAVGSDCITASVGFRSPSRFELADALLPRLLDPDDEDARPDLQLRYRDPGQLPTATPAAIPEALTAFAQESLQRALADPELLARCLGEWLSEPKARQAFEPLIGDGVGVQLAPSSRMLYDRWHVFLNGEAYRAAGHSLFTVQTMIFNLAEAHLGDTLDLALQLIDADDKRLHIFHTMHHGETGELLATGEQMLVHVDMNAGKSAPMPPELHRRVHAVLAAHSGLERPAQVGRSIGIRRDTK